jgi:hypothetical protein
MMKDRDLLKVLWKMLKDDLFNGKVPTDGELAQVIEELHNRGLEKAKYLDEIR